MPTPSDLRIAVDGVAAEAARTLDAVWLAGLSVYDTRAVLAESLPGVLEEYGLASGAYAADWYDEYRLEQDVPGRFAARTAELRDPGVTGLVGWATVPLDKPVPDFRRAQVLLDGGVQLRVANEARDTVIDSSLRDTASGGWMRAGSGSCTFCSMLIGRGGVYSDRTAFFASHEHCHCTAVPAFDRKRFAFHRDPRGPRNTSDADRARVRQWMRDNPDG